MDTTNQIATYVRRRTHSNAVSYPNSDILIDLNLRYRRAITAITWKVQDFFWTWWTFNTVTTQNEYEIAQFTFTDTFTRDIISVDSVAIKYRANQDYLKLKKRDFNALDFDLTQYTDWAGEPFYFVRDKSIFIAPNALENVTAWGILYGNYRPLDLTLSDSTTEIKIPLLYTYVLAEGVCADYWTSQGEYDKANVFEARFTEGLQTMVNNLSIRDREIMSYEY